jgi:hypothetical protein
MKKIFETLHEQRWDDHRYYHHSRINQSLHLLSALSFLFGYVLLFIDPVSAALVAWLVAMTSRQIGHFFFEPKTHARSQGRHQGGLQLASQSHFAEHLGCLASVDLVQPVYVWIAAYWCRHDQLCAQCR